MRLLPDSDVKSLLRRYSVKPQKKLGQSFLTNHTIARKIVDQAELGPEDVVLEIGGGLGVLSSKLAKRAGKVYVIEIDPGLVQALKDSLNDVDNVTIIEGDALRVALPEINKIVSNLPYRISSEVTFRLLTEVQFDLAILMYQKEFAQRLVARPCVKEYSRLTIDISYHADTTRLFDVPSQMFYPEPAVNSTVVRMVHRTDGSFAIDVDVFLWMVRGLYSYPNKQIRKALGIWFRNLGREKSLADNLLGRVSSIAGNERLRCLSQETLVEMADRILDMITEGLLDDPRGAS
ncbi:MAG: 16S rRNA (adenine(1518)-N(6)/adenine(1519)-N(6))-dimethyltransferase RsmA [Candidatus Thorarchaeota archaeon]